MDLMQAKLDAIRELCEYSWINLDVDLFDEEIREFGLVVPVENVLDILNATSEEELEG